MGLGFKENSVNNTNMTQYRNNYEHIFGGKMQEDQVEMELPAHKTVTTAELDDQIERLSMLRKRYQGYKTEASDAHLEMKEQESRVMTMLDVAGKKSYKVDGLATVTKKEKLAVTTPKSTDAKKLFFEWIRTKLGDEAMWAYTSVNSNTLNSLSNEQAKECEERGEALDMAGIDMPTTRTTLSFRAVNN